MSNSKKQYIWLVVIIPIIGYGLFLGFFEEEELSEHGRYTIGTTESFYLTTKGGRNIWYEYEVNGIKYKNGAPYQWNAKVPNGRYYVKFSSKDPDISMIYLDKPVPDHIELAPSEGWSVNKQ